MKSKRLLHEVESGYALLASDGELILHAPGDSKDRVRTKSDVEADAGWRMRFLPGRNYKVVRVRQVHSITVTVVEGN